MSTASPDNAPELTRKDSKTPSSRNEKSVDVKNVEADSLDAPLGVALEKSEQVAVTVLSTQDDPSQKAFTFRTVFLGLGLSAFGSVLATIYTFKPQNATVSQLFVLIIAYVLGTAMASTIPSRGSWRYLNPGPFNIKEHTAIVIMSSTASQVAVGMEIVAALDLFYDIKLNPGIAIFSIFSSQMVGYGIAGLLRTYLVYPTYAFFPTYISVATLLQSLHFSGDLNAKKRKFFWIVFIAIFCWEWIPQYAFPLLTAISVVCLADNGKHVFVRNLFGAGSSNEGLGLLSFSTSWSLITQGNPLVWPWRTQVNSYMGMAIGYIVLTTAYYANRFGGRNLKFMSTSLFDASGDVYNQTAVITKDYGLDMDALETVGLPRYTTTYAISQLAYNVSLGSAVTSIFLWHWKELKDAFGGLRFLKSGPADIDDPHYQEMKKYDEVPQWWYLTLFVVAVAVGIGCAHGGPNGLVLMPAWSILFFTVFSCFIATILGFISATTGFNLSIKYAVQIMAAFIHPGKPINVMFANLYGNSTSFQTLYMLQDLKLGQYTKLPPKATFASQMAGSVIGSIFNYAMMLTIVSANREVLRDPVGTRLWSGWIVQQYNSASVAMGALGKELYTIGKPSGYWIIPFGMFLGLFAPLPFWLVYRMSNPESKLARAMKFINVPVLALYVGWLPYSVNGMWWSCLVIGFTSQYWARRYRPGWFVKYNYLMSAALDGGSQVILFILSFAVFGASGNSVLFPTWWGNPGHLSADRCMST